MYTPINSLPDNSRIWIYQADRALTAPDMEFISSHLKTFCDTWATHGSGLKTSYSVELHRFIILAVDEQAGGASGCSIDSSVHAIKVIEQALNIDFFNRAQIAFWENESVAMRPLTALKKLFAEGALNTESVTLNTQAATLGEWRHARHIQVGNSWLKRYLPQESVL